MPTEKPLPIVPLLSPILPPASGRIAPAQVWRQLTALQQQQIQHTVVTICQQWLTAILSTSLLENFHDPVSISDGFNQDPARPSGA